MRWDSTRFAVIALTLAAFGLWMLVLTNRSLWADEFATIRILERPTFESMLAYTPQTEQRPPLFYALLWMWQRLVGPHELSLRVFSLFFAVLAIPLIWAFTRAFVRLYGMSSTRLPAVTTALLLCSPVMSLYGVMLRNFSMMAALSLLSSWLFVRLIRLSEERSTLRNPRVVLAFGAWLAVALVLIYTDYYSWAIVGAQLCWAAFRPTARKRLLRLWLAGIAILVTAFVPLIIPLLQQIGRGRQDADLSRDFAGLVLRIASPLYIFLFGETVLPWHPTVLIAAPLVLSALIIAFSKRPVREMLLLPLLLALLPLAFNVAVISFVATDLTFLSTASRTLPALPMLLLIAAIGWQNSSQVQARLAMPALLCVYLGAQFNLVNRIEYLNPIYAVPLREIHGNLSSRAMPGDLIISDFDILYQYYYDRDPIPSTTLIITEEENLPAIERAVLNKPPRVWLFTYGRDRSLVGDRGPKVRAWLDASGYRAGSPDCFAPTDPTYRILKERLIPRGAYACKLMVTLYEGERQ